MNRLTSALRQLGVLGPALRVLEVGCGAYPAALEPLEPENYIGLDVDGAALDSARRVRPGVRLIQADAHTLPGLLRAEFGLVLVRHPDIMRSHLAWRAILPELRGCLAPGGVLLITLYVPEEVEFVESLTLPSRHPLDEHALVPPTLAGRDRFVRAYHA